MNTRTRRLETAAWLAALALLVLVLAVVNGPAGEPPAEALSGETAAQDDGTPVGHAPGERLPDFTLTTLDGGTWHLAEMRGRVVVLNLWATWCGPCVNELPYFQRIHEEYGGRVAVLAVHSDLITDDVAAYLADKGYTMAFAAEDTAEAVLLMGGSVMLPQTLVLDAAGVVTWNQVGSVTQEKLEALVAEALAR